MSTIHAIFGTIPNGIRREDTGARATPGAKATMSICLSMFDTLAVPVICGTGDTGIANNFSFKPIQVQIFRPSAETEALVESYERKYESVQRELESFKGRPSKPIENFGKTRAMFPNLSDFRCRLAVSP